MASNKLITLVTGGNTGIGYHIVQQFSNTNEHHVLLGSRNLSKADAAIEQMKADKEDPSNTSNIEPIEIDVNSDASIAAAAKLVGEKFGRLDILVNNAGISKAVGVHSDNAPNADGSGPSLREQYQQQYDTNVFGAAVTTETFVPLLRKSTLEGGKRVAFTGSSTSSLALAVDPPYPNLKGRNYRIYRSTKTALNMLLVSYADELEEEGFVVSAACPGYCSTNLNGYQGFKHPREGAKAIVHVAVAPKTEVHSKLINDDGQIPW